MELKNAAAIVTGGASGLGGAAAELPAAQEANVTDDASMAAGIRLYGAMRMAPR